ncbi:MAG: heavy-metal-associated domain-containing protein [Alphaproteobacteria bacterium]|nr:heavy-metal-associated domain-containing protein [Alphaproteobacteria bacterium]
MSQTLTLPVTGMTCGGCEASVQRALSRVEGVVEVRADHVAQRVDLVLSSPVPSRERLVAAVEAAGFDVPA